MSFDSFKEREKGYENKFAHDAELRFKAEMRRNKLLALWAADLMGLNEEDSKALVGTLIKADLEEVGDDDVFRRMTKVFADHGVEISEHRLRREMDEKMAEAQKQVMREAD